MLESHRIYRYIDLTSVSLETKKITETTEIIANNAPSRAQKLVEKNDVIFATTRPAQQRYCLIENEYSGEVASTGYCILRAEKDKVLPKWILYCIASNAFKIYVEENQSGSAYPAISDTKVKDFIIPIPCPDNPDRSLAIQAEIVRILDTFTALTAELTTELGDRKKQYNYSRDRLLTFGDEVPVVQLSNCCVSIADGDHQPPPKTDTGIPFITISNVSNSRQIDFINTRFVSEAYYGELDDKRKARKNDILYTVVGSFGIPVFIDDNRKFAFQRHIAILRPNGNVIVPKYLYHVLRSSDFLKQAYAVAVGAAQKTITLTALNRMKVPLPPLEEQARIVAILDKFDTLTTSISEGLPHEIALRQKQYEYYRDLLLTFPPPLTPP
ncbi:MAG: restriction endonuclease subunit S [Spirulinaceae cyanobacterium SM2_1_0]|nr:restriction endonuclease subunit S [Spirulinaceae cyanobacterium SM2_1_0]